MFFLILSWPEPNCFGCLQAAVQGGPGRAPRASPTSTSPNTLTASFTSMPSTTSPTEDHTGMVARTSWQRETFCKGLVDWSVTQSGGLKSKARRTWSQPQGCQSFRSIWTMPSDTGWNSWGVFAGQGVELNDFCGFLPTQDIP